MGLGSGRIPRLPHGTFRCVAGGVSLEPVPLGQGPHFDGHPGIFYPNTPMQINDPERTRQAAPELRLDAPGADDFTEHPLSMNGEAPAGKSVRNGKGAPAAPSFSCSTSCPLSHVPQKAWLHLFRVPFRKRHPVIFWGLLILLLGGIAAFMVSQATGLGSERIALVRVTGPIMDCQLIETALLNCVNFETLIATKAARVCLAAQAPVAEFGLRRAQGAGGGLWASRAAVVGGCASTSNVLAGKLFDIPVSGTHAHSWVMSFPDELTAFRAYAEAFPKNCVLLVDTYDVEQGIKNAITVGLEMRERGERLSGIRIDSGDLSWLARMARAMLDEAGLTDCGIVLSNDLDEFTIQSSATRGPR